MAKNTASLYQYVALYYARKDESPPLPEIISGPEYVIAKSEKEVLMKVARSLPESYTDKLEEVDVLVRPF